MSQRNITFVPQEFYHVYNRGTDKRTIFLDDRDYQRFGNLLYLCNSTESINLRNIYRDYKSVYDFDRGETLVSIGAYCLMPNHFHILITPEVEAGVSKFMNKLGTSYSMYFNKRYERTGALFQGRFKSEYVDDDVYLRYLFSYIHLNPVKLKWPNWREGGVVDEDEVLAHVRNYKYSSAAGYLSVRDNVNQIIEADKFPEYFSSVSAQVNELLEWITYKSSTT